ncbi:Domain of unknown function (DUF3841)-containing protein [uncultured virus]|nr:Domain of unknown function (DUF3841)-containing protein [uncultured virus]
MIRLWTFQTEDAFHEFEKNGCLVGNFSEPNYAQAYDWMVNEMKKKIGPPAVEGQYPIWAWYKCEDVDVQTGHLHVGQKGVRIEFEIDPSQAVLFADDGWMHSVNYGYLGTSEEDCENFYKEVNDAGLYHLDHPRFIPLPEPYNQRIQKSWERIFDLDWVVEGWTVLLKDRFVRAALWKLNKDQVRDVKWFTAKEQMSDWKELDIDINGLSSNAVHSKVC